MAIKKSAPAKPSVKAGTVSVRISRAYRGLWERICKENDVDTSLSEDRAEAWQGVYKAKGKADDIAECMKEIQRLAARGVTELPESK